MSRLRRSRREGGTQSIANALKSAPVSRGALANRDHWPYRSLGCLGFDEFAVAVPIADGDTPRPFCFGDLANQIDVQQAVFKLCAADLDIVCEFEHAFKGARRDASIQGLRVL